VKKTAVLLKRKPAPTPAKLRKRLGFSGRFLFYAQDTTPYGQKTHPALRYQKKFKYFNGDEFIEGTDYWMAE
jgi:hypothetical protein